MKRISISLLAIIACLTAAQAQNSPASSPAGDANHSQGTLATPTGSQVLIVGGFNTSTDFSENSAELFVEAAHAFVSTGSLKEDEGAQQATLLQSGQVLFSGDDNPAAQLYDPGTGTFRIAGSTILVNANTATLLQNGQVLVAGGALHDPGAPITPTNVAQLFDPVTGTYHPTGNMTQVRGLHSATLLPSGKVLIAGGENASAILSSAELYDPATGTFSLTGSMSIPRTGATATLLANGNVLIAGGGSLVGNCSGCSVASAEIYDSQSGHFSPVGEMKFPRRGLIAVLLQNHDVLVAGGIDDNLPDPARFLTAAELFDPLTLTFSPTSNMTTPRFEHAASVLADGNVLVTGGFNTAFTVTNSAELFDPVNQSFTATGKMANARYLHTSTLLSNQANLGLTIRSIAASNTAVPGGNIDYGITLTNFGPDASSVKVTDILPPQTKFVSCNSDAGGICSITGNNVTIDFSTITSGHSAYITLVAQVAPTVSGGELISNTSTIASATPAPNPNSNSSVINTVIRYTSDLSIQNTVMNPGGGELQYQINVSASSPVHGVTITDPLPSGTTFVSATTGTCATPAVGASGTVVCSFGSSSFAAVLLTVKVTAPSGTTISNTATVTAQTFDPNQANNSSTATITVP